MALRGSAVATGAHASGAAPRPPRSSASMSAQPAALLPPPATYQASPSSAPAWPARRAARPVGARRAERARAPRRRRTRAPQVQPHGGTAGARLRAGRARRRRWPAGSTPCCACPGSAGPRSRPPRCRRRTPAGSGRERPRRCARCRARARGLSERAGSRRVSRAMVGNRAAQPARCKCEGRPGRGRGGGRRACAARAGRRSWRRAATSRRPGRGCAARPAGGARSPRRQTQTRARPPASPARRGPSPLPGMQGQRAACGGVAVARHAARAACAVQPEGRTEWLPRGEGACPLGDSSVHVRASVSNARTVSAAAASFTCAPAGRSCRATGSGG